MLQENLLGQFVGPAGCRKLLQIYPVTLVDEPEFPVEALVERPGILHRRRQISGKRIKCLFDFRVKEFLRKRGIVHLPQPAQLLLYSRKALFFLQALLRASP